MKDKDFDRYMDYKEKGVGMKIEKMQKVVHEIAQDKGFWNSARNDGELIALMHSELSEALEALRHDNWNGKGCVGEELADCVIRIMDYCEARDIDLEEEIQKKIEFNKKRPYRHGNKF